MRPSQESTSSRTWPRGSETSWEAVQSYEEELIQARETALAEMVQRAQELGAEGVVGVDLDYETLGTDNGMLMVTASGTAVRFSPVS